MTGVTARINSTGTLARGARASAVSLSGSRESAFYDVTKAAFDLVFGAVMLIVSAPLMLAVAILIKLTSRGPVIFKQQRAGLHAKPFTMYKFRTMYQDAEDDRQYMAHLNEKDGPVFKIANDPRLTLVGRFLRRSSIDELPQLVNVLGGQMSLVGPRPLWTPEARRVNGVAKLRSSVRPGLTCLWQISGRSELSFERCVRLDLYYVFHRSLLLDLLILIQTIPVVLSGHGAY